MTYGGHSSIERSMIDAQDDVFEDLYQRYRADIWALVYAHCLNADTALDVTQEAFLRLWEQRERGEQIAHPRAWLRRVARNLAKDFNRCAFRRNGTRPPEVMSALHGSEPAPEQCLAKKEVFARLHEAMAQLPHSDREVLTLRYGLGYSGKKIGRLLAMNTNAVHMRACRARQRLAGLLATCGIHGTA